MKKWRNLFLALGLALCIGAGACASKQAVVSVRAEETAEVAEEEKEGWAKSAFENYIVPLFTIGTVTSIVSGAIGIIITVRKNKKLDDKIFEANQKVVQATEIMKQCTAILETIKKILDIVQNSNQLTQEVKSFIEQKMSEALKVVNESKVEVLKIEKLSQAISLLTQLEAKVAKQSPEIIKSGIVEDINKITSLVKSL